MIKYGASINPSFNFNNAFNISGKMDELKNRLDFGKEVDEGVNWAYLTSSLDPTSIAIMSFLLFINLTYTSINERREELKTIHAVGTTYKQIKNMLTAEGMMRIMLAFVVVFTIGIGLNRIIVNMIAGQMIMFRYQFVAWPMIAAIPLFLFIAAVIPGKIRWNSKEQT